MSADERVRIAADVVAELAGEFSDLARLLAEGESIPHTLERLVQVAAKAVPGTEHSAITLIHHDGPPRTVAYSDEVPVLVDKLEYELQEGPCIQALVASDIAVVNDLATDQQWPAFAAQAVRETGIRSMLSYRLYLSGDDRGALNFYASRADAFPLPSLATGSIFAAYASLALLAAVNQEKALNLTRALESNREIGAAMGILMASKKVTQQEAFDRLRVASQQLHRKLRDIAEEVTVTGELPELPEPANKPRHPG
jgi:hypothetical protein